MGHIGEQFPAVRAPSVCDFVYYNNKVLEWLRIAVEKLVNPKKDQGFSSVQ